MVVTGATASAPGGAARISVGAEVPVTATHRLAGPANNSPLIVRDPTDDRVLVLANRLDAPDFSCGLQVSGDTGTSWIDARGPAYPPGVEKCYAPEVVFDRHGRLYFLFVGLAGAGNRPMGVFLATSTDRASTFGPPRQVLGPLRFGVRMAIDPSWGRHGRLHLVWLEALSDVGAGGFAKANNPILSAYSDDGGVTFSDPVRVSDRDRPLALAPALSVGPHHRVHVAYYDLGDDRRDYLALEGPVWDGTWSVVVASSGDGGRTFGTGLVADDAIRPPERVMTSFTMPPPSLVTGAGRLCVAWTDGRHGDADAMARCSAGDGRAFGPLRRLNDDPVGNGLRQYLPRLSLAPDGRLDAVFLDRRRDPNNASNDVYYTSSDDGGDRFSPNRRLDREPSNAGIGQRYAVVSANGLVEFGGRLGLLSGRREAFVAWPDTRNAAGETPSAGTGQDIMFSRVGLPASRSGIPLAPVLVGALLLAAAVAGARALRSRPGILDSPHAPQPDTPLSPTGSGVPGRHRRRALLGALCAVAVVGVLMARWDSPRRGASLPPKPQVVDVSMRDYRFAFNAPTAPGRAVFRVRNDGKKDHQLGIYPLPDDMPPIDAQLHGSERRTVTAVADLPIRHPGQSQTFALDLEPGQRYALLCFLPTDDDSNHAYKGMNAEFRAGGTKQQPEAAEPPGRSTPGGAPISPPPSSISP